MRIIYTNSFSTTKKIMNIKKKIKWNVEYASWQILFLGGRLLNSSRPELITPRSVNECEIVIWDRCHLIEVERNSKRD